MAKDADVNDGKDEDAPIQAVEETQDVAENKEDTQARRYVSFEVRYNTDLVESG